MVKISFQPTLGLKPEDEKGEKTEALIPTSYDTNLNVAPEEEQTSQVRTRRSSLSGLCCLTFSLIVLLLGLVLASFYVYRYYFNTRVPQENVFHCRLLYEDSSYAPLKKQMELQEDVEIHFDDNYEFINIPVPQFGGSDSAEIIHDFHRKLTAYHDVALNKCYITELNTTIVMPPRNFRELLINVKKGSYLPQVYIIQEEMIVTGQVNDMGPLGVFISRLCTGKETFNLKRRLTRQRIDKREVKNCHRIRHFENKFVVETLICQ